MYRRTQKQHRRYTNFASFFEEHFNDTKCHVYEYCAKCHRLLDSEVTGGAGCSSGCGGSTVNQFIFISVEAQLKKNLKVNTLYLATCSMVILEL